MRELSGTSVRRRIPVRDEHHTTATLDSDIISPYLMLEELEIDDETDVMPNLAPNPSTMPHF